MSIVEKPIFGLVKQRNDDNYNVEVNGTSNSFTNQKPIWNENSSLTYTMNVNRSLTIVSTSNHDVSSGTGVKTIRVTGLIYSLENGVSLYKDQVVDVTMNGTTPVAIGGSWYRVTKLESIEFGSGLGLANQGDIKVVIAGTAFVFNCMKALDNVSNSLIISPSTGNCVILENITINAYFHTLAELEFRIINLDGSITKFQKLFLNTNSPYMIIPINKQLLAGETFYIVMTNLEPIIGTNHISCMLQATNLQSGGVLQVNKPFPEYGTSAFLPNPAPSAPT